MTWLDGIVLFLLTVLAMEGVAYGAHRWIMHGPGWFLHESHHRERNGPFEANDLYALIFAIPSIVLLYGGVNVEWGIWAIWVGAAIAAYGAIYFGFHDVIVHRRVQHRYVPRSRYMKRIVQAHRPSASSPPCDRKQGGIGQLWLHLGAQSRRAEGRTGPARASGAQSAVSGRVQRPERSLLGGGTAASHAAAMTWRSFSAFETMVRLSHAEGPRSATFSAMAP